MIRHKLERVLDSIVEGTIKQKYVWKNYIDHPDKINKFITNKEVLENIKYSDAVFFEKDKQIILLTGSHMNNIENAYTLFIIDKDSKKVSKFLIDYPNYIRITNHIRRMEDEKNRMLDDFLN